MGQPYARRLKPRRAAAEKPSRGPECGTRPCRGTRRERHPPQSRPASGAAARRRARPAPGAPAAVRQRPRGRPRARGRHDARQALALPRDRRARHRLRGRGPAPLPRQRLPPARLDLVRLPRDSERGAELRDAAPAAGRRAPGRGAPRARARDGRHRLGQDDHARGRDRPHQPLAPPAHRHDRGPDRDPPRRPRLHRQPARGRPRHRVVPRRDPPRAASGPGRDPDRRAARRRDRRDRAQGRGVRSPRLLDDAHDRRRRDDRPDGRVLPGREAGPDPLDPRRRAPRRDQPAAAAQADRRPRGGGRGDGQQLAHLRLDPREQDRGDHRRDRRGPVLRHADLQPGADRARRGRRGRPRHGGERIDEPALLPRLARPGAQAEGRRGQDRPARLRGGAGATEARGAAGSSASHRRAGRMKRLLAVAIAALALSGSAGADVFKVVPSVMPSAPATLPSAELPNTPGAIEFPAALLQRPAFVETRTYDQLFTLWQRNGTLYGVPWQVLAAINKIESNFGTNMGPSSAGAIGWMQFMPSTWERWGVDADGDGIANPWSPEDAIAAAARYLAASGGGSDISRAVFSYNHAQWYVDEVLQLAQSFGTGGLDATFTADPLRASFAENTQAVASAKQRLARAERDLRALSRRGRALNRRAASASLLSDRLELDQRAVRFGIRVDTARTRVAHFEAALTKARQELVLAHDRSLASSFAPAAGSLLAAPAYDGQYVF